MSDVVYCIINHCECLKMNLDCMRYPAKYSRTSHTNLAKPRGTPTNERAVTPALLSTMTITHRSEYLHAEAPIPQSDRNTKDLFKEKLKTELKRRAANPLAQMTPVVVTPNALNATANPQARL